jgi:hypothetical protein
MTLGSTGASPGGEATSESQVALQGGKQNSSPPSLPGVAAELAWQLAWQLVWQLHGVADVQPAAGISFSKMAANQASCPSTPQATTPSSLTVRTVSR